MRFLRKTKGKGKSIKRISISRKEARRLSPLLSQKSKVESKKVRNNHFTQGGKEGKPAIQQSAYLVKNQK
jgi:hypothetical protein